MDTTPYRNPEQVRRIEKALAERILVLDGAMGTMIQDHWLDEPDFRGERFASHGDRRSRMGQGWSRHGTLNGTSP